MQWRNTSNRLVATQRNLSLHVIWTVGCGPGQEGRQVRVQHAFGLGSKSQRLQSRVETPQLLLQTDHKWHFCHIASFQWKLNVQWLWKKKTSKKFKLTHSFFIRRTRRSWTSEKAPQQIKCVITIIVYKWWREHGEYWNCYFSKSIFSPLTHSVLEWSDCWKCEDVPQLNKSFTF